MKVKEVADRLSVSEQSIRNWSRDFADHLGPAASPEKGATRQYSEDDLRILAAVKHGKDSGRTDDEIRDALASGSIDLEAIPLPDNAGQSRALEVPFSLAGFLDGLQSENRHLQDRIAELEHQVGYLEGKLESRKSLWDRLRGA